MLVLKTPHLIAWVGVPFVFGLFVSLTYTFSLRLGNLPFLGTNELKWWLAFVIALAVGTTSVAIANRGNRFWKVFGPFVYLVVMPAVLLVVHLLVACAHGDCL